MDRELIIAIVASLVSLASAVLSVLAGIRTTQLEHRLAKEREERLRQLHAEDVVGRFREPILRAAIDLQSRLFNIVRQEFLQVYYFGQEAEREYAVANTMYVIAEYLAWVEILRREIQFLDLGDIKKNQSLSTLLERISTVLLSDRTNDPFRLFRGEQRAIGELMLVPRATNDGVHFECLGYAAFVEKLNDPQFAKWFRRLEDDIDRLAQGRKVKQDRLRDLQHTLIDLIDFFDHERTRVPESHRQKLP